MGRVGDAFCCCFRGHQSSYCEVAPECDEFVILTTKRPTSDLTESLIDPRGQSNLPQIEIVKTRDRDREKTDLHCFCDIQEEDEIEEEEEDEHLLIKNNKNNNNSNNKSNNNCNNNNNEIEQSLAAAISDRATDEILEALTRYRRGLGIADSPSVMLDEPQTPDIVRSRSSHDTEGIIMRPGRNSILPKLGMESPTKLEYLNLATPNMPTKRRSVARKVRPQSVVENLSLGHIPDLLESPSSHRSNSQTSRRDSSTNGDCTLTSDSHGALDDCGGDECCDSITELPSASFQLQHLVKGRPKRAKTRAPTRPLVAAVENGASIREIGEGLDQFFRPGSATPTTLTPLVSPTSEECSSLSFVDSPTMSRNGNDNMTSEETTPILEERRPIKLERHSPLLKGAAWATRSRSTDNLEKYSPLVGRKSPLVKMRTEGGGPSNGLASTNTSTDSSLPPTPAERLLRSSAARDDKMRSPSTDSIKAHAHVDPTIFTKTGNGILRTPGVLQKPRPWSVVGSEPKSSDSSKTTPEKLDEEVEAATFGQGNGDSILPTSGSTGGAALEKRSVRELAAGLNRLDLPLKPQALPRSLLTSASSSAIPSQHQTSSSSKISHSIRNNKSSSTTASSSSSSSLQSSSTTSSTTTTTITMSSSLSEFNSSKIQNSITSESKAMMSKSVITENNGTNEILNIRNNTRTPSTSSTSSSNSNSSSSIQSKLRDFLNNEKHIKENTADNGGLSASSGAAATTPAVFKRIAGKEIASVFEETLVEGLQQRSTALRRTFRDNHYTEDDVVEL